MPQLGQSPLQTDKTRHLGIEHQGKVVHPRHYLLQGIAPFPLAQSIRQPPDSPLADQIAPEVRLQNQGPLSQRVEATLTRSHTASDNETWH
ncbi:hypothetical protein D3C78_1500740 [compost metagenome]